MGDFTLDTSGEVLAKRASSGGPFAFRWSDLSPFEQGYVEALFASGVKGRGLWITTKAWAFSDLAPEALEAIRRDCARFLALGLGENEREHGRRFWIMLRRRQVGGGWHPDFPPLTVTLGDDGKVHLSGEAA